MKPLNKLCLIEKLDDSNTTASGIILQKGQDNPKGKVLFTGTKASGDICEGDTVLYYRGRGTEIDYNGKDCLMLDEDRDLISVL